MHGSFKKAAAILLAVVLLACIAVGVAMGWLPTFTGILVGIAAAAVCILWRFMRQNEPARPMGEETTAGQAPLSALSRRYEQALAAAGPPGDAHSLQMPCDLFFPYTASLWFYCWKTAGYLQFFPRWDDVERLILQLGQIGTDVAWDDLHFRMACIPLEDIVCYAGEPTREGKQPFVLLHYRDNLGEDAGLLLRDNAWPVLKALLPHQDQETISARRYPQSARQISDITAKLQQLKALHMQTLIDEEEYNAKKKEILLTL